MGYYVVTAHATYIQYSFACDKYLAFTMSLRLSNHFHCNFYVKANFLYNYNISFNKFNIIYISR